MRAAIRLGLLLVMVTYGVAHARDREDRSLGAEMSRDRAENRIERLKMDRSEKDRQDRARAEGVRKEGAKQRTKP